MTYRNGDIIRLKRAVTGSGWSTDLTYPHAAGTLGTVVTPGDAQCQAEFVVELPGGGIECTLASIGPGDADVVPPAQASALAAE